MSRGTRRLVTVFCALLLCLAGAAASAPMAAAQSAAAQSTAADVRVSFSRIDATPTATGEVTIVVEITNAARAALTEVTGTLAVGARLTSRFALHRALGEPSASAADDDPPALPGPVRTRTERAGPVVPADSSRLLVFETSLDELDLPEPRTRQAVYPLQVTIRAGDSDVGRLTTALVVLPAQVDAPLQGGTLVRIDADLDDTPLLEAASRAVAADAASPTSLPDGDQLERLAAALAAAQVPVSVALDNALARAVPGVDGVAEMLARPEVERVLMPYAGADLVALHRGDLTDLARRELQLGAAAWPGTTVDADRTIVAPAADLDGATVTEVLEPFGVEAVVVGEEGLVIAEDRRLPTSPAPVRDLVVDGVPTGGLQALVPDPWLDEALAAGHLDVATIQRVLAETAIVHLERPGTQAVRGVLLQVPGRAHPAGIEALLTALDAAAWIEPVTLGELRATVPTAGTARLDDTDASAASLPDAYIADLAAAGASLTALQGVLTESRDGVDDLRDDLLLAASADFRDAPAAGRRLMADVREAAADVLGAVAVVGEPTITFTDSVGQLPVVLANRAPVPLRVRVELTSQRLSFPTEDIEVELAADTTTTVLVDTEARTPGGTAPVDVVVTDPTGSRQLANGTLVVRIAAYPLLALVLVGLSALLLVLWWVRDLRRRRVPAEVG